MSYVLGAPKRVEIGGITWIVNTPAGAFSAWEDTSREVIARLEEAQALTDPVERGKMLRELGEVQRRQETAAFNFVVGWEGVTDLAGNPIPFSQEALQQVDTGVLRLLGLALAAEGEQVLERVQAGNASWSGESKAS